MIAILFCLAGILVLQLLTPYWWWVMIVPFAFGVIGGRSAWKAFRTGFLSAGLLWTGWSAIIFFSDGRAIAGRMIAMLGLGHSWLMIVVTGFIGAIAAGFSGYAGHAVRGLLSIKHQP